MTIPLLLAPAFGSSNEYPQKYLLGDRFRFLNYQAQTTVPVHVYESEEYLNGSKVDLFCVSLCSPGFGDFAGRSMKRTQIDLVQVIRDRVRTRYTIGFATNCFATISRCSLETTRGQARLLAVQAAF